jgi:hypothetical protein
MQARQRLRPAVLTGTSAGHLNADRKYITVTPVAHIVHMLVHVKAWNMHELTYGRGASPTHTQPIKARPALPPFLPWAVKHFQGLLARQHAYANLQPTDLGH